MIEIISKIDATIDTIDNSTTIKKLKELKMVMDKDLEIQQLFNRYNILKDQYSNDSIITEELVNAKKNLFNHPIVAEYRRLYNEFNLSIIRFNKNISSLLDINNYHCSKA